jgi:hypothetical protein
MKAEMLKYFIAVQSPMEHLQVQGELFSGKAAFKSLK